MSDSKSPEQLLAHDGIVPGQVRRLQLGPDDTLVVLVDGLTPSQMREYQAWLEAVFPDHPVKVLIGTDIVVLGPQEQIGGGDA